MNRRESIPSSFLCILVIIILVDFGKAQENGKQEKILSRQKRLLFSQYESLNLAMAVVEPIEMLKGGMTSFHRVSLNTGFNAGYGLPYKVSQFTAPLYWSARSLVDKVTKDSIFENSEADGNTTDYSSALSSGYQENADESEIGHKKVKRDITAGEFYSSIKQTFEMMGFDEECVLKSICELAKVPFHLEEEENLLHEVLHFLLTPSVHQAFDEDLETEEKRIHEEAEMIGKTSGLCDEAYPKCPVTPLHKRSEFFDLNDLD